MAEHSFLRTIWLVLKTVQARLRFVVILVAIGGLIASWDTIWAYYEKWTRPGREADAASGDTEFYCPMHPFIVRDKPREKCPICHMDLVKRKKGKPEPLAAGTVNRVQLSPYRVVLAGVHTTELHFETLSKEITAYGTVEFDETKQAHIPSRQKARIEKLLVNFTGESVDKNQPLAILDIRYSPELTATLEDLLRAQQNRNQEAVNSALKRLQRWEIGPDQIKELIGTGKLETRLTVYSPIHGHVISKYQKEGDIVDEGTLLYDIADIATVWFEAQIYEADQVLIKEKQEVTATTLSLPGQEFPGKVSFIYPHLDEITRTLRVRIELPNPRHILRPHMYGSVKLRVMPEQIDMLASAYADDPERRAELRKNRVLAVPDSAVIDTGSMKIVYREASPNVFEGVAVKLGPRMTMTIEGQSVAVYPVLSGLQVDERIVTNGSFLIDAETRLNPAIGSIYYGGTSGGKSGASPVTVLPSTPEDADTLEKRARVELQKLDPEDRRLAEAQRSCPIKPTKLLGSMGAPFKLILGDNQPVFLCCESCVDRAKNDEEQTLAKVKQLKDKAKAEKPRE